MNEKFGGKRLKKVIRKFSSGKSRIIWGNGLEKSEFFLEICLEKSEIFHPDPRPPDFKADWRRWRRSSGEF